MDGGNSTGKLYLEALYGRRVLALHPYLHADTVGADPIGALRMALSDGEYCPGQRSRAGSPSETDNPLLVPCNRYPRRAITSRRMQFA